ncbi:MAG: hypothetical protein ACJAZS_000422 [Alteromonas naphthalenivorans]
MNKTGLLFFSLTFNASIAINIKPHTFMVFMERNNDLDPFASLNIKQMEHVGSNEHINIIVYMHCRENKTKTLFIKKNESTLLRETKPNRRTFNIKHELIQFCAETIQNYPAENYSLILWDHGTGAIEPCFRNITSSIFSYAPTQQHPQSQHTTLLLKNISRKKQHILKGVCFDDSEGTFLSEKDLQSALETICATSLCKKKFDLIGFDACLMSMIEVGSSIKNYATYMVGSQEVELGTGWNYARVFAPFLLGNISPRTLSLHIVNSYAKSYQKTDDYTQSAINLSVLSELEQNVHSVAQHLTSLLKQQQSNVFRRALKASRNKHYCTHFDEPDFIDLHHFYKNLLSNASQIALLDEKSNTLLKSLRQELINGCLLIKETVVANKAGTKKALATGISIYFPEKQIYSSYHRAAFTLSNQSWINFLRIYLSE